MDEVAGSSTNVAVAATSGRDRIEPLDQCAPMCTDVLDAASLHLVRSKLRPPLPPATCIQRPSLVARIDAVSHRKLLLLAAPVGSGKTTLLTQWYGQAAMQRPVAWLSLDEGDDDPVRFFAYLVEAIRGAMPGFDACVPGCHDADQRFPLRQVVTVVGEALERLSQDLVIVLDDFQWLTAPAVLRAIDFLVNRSPQNIHWILSGRRAPDLNLGPLRLCDQLATLDALDLNFCSASILQLSQGLCRQPLSAAEADGIRSRTEGWVAGVKLALLSAAGPQAAGSAGQPFTGSNAKLAQYFANSLLQEQTGEVRQFLVATSIVDRMTGDLCNALLGITHGQSLLEELERMQLFIQPLDSHAHWYRYHTLFHDFLRGSLRRDVARMDALHERASRWFAEHQLYEEALQHAFAGSNAAWRLELVVRCVQAWRQGGEVANVIRWCEQLPRAEVLGHEVICSAYTGGLILSRRFGEAAVMLDELHARAAAGRPVDAVRMRMLRMMLAILSDGSGEPAVDAFDPPQEDSPDRYLSGVLLTLQAYALLRRHEFDAAWRLAMRACDALETVSLHGHGYASMVASLAERARGDVRAAAQRCKQTFARVRGGRRSPTWVNAATALAHVRYEENRLVDAEALCTEVLPLLPVAATVECFSSAYFTLARIKAVNQRDGEAFQLLDYLHSVLESGRQRRFLAQLCVEKMRLCLAQDDLERARKVAGEFGLPQLAAEGAWREPRPYDEAWERFGFAQACLLMHEQDHAGSRALFEVLRDSARSVGHVHREITLDAALAASHWLAGDPETAFRCLNRGFALTSGLGFSRGVFDELPVLAQVVAAAYRQRRLQLPLPPEYFQKFDSLRGSCAVPAPAELRRLKPALPLEQLTEREVDLLRLLARGLSNQEISAHSQIALSTTKWHLKNVFAKLDVNTRTGAIARARELQLIE
jgi:LuxR family maltose regulon positive regulatory protein